MIKSLISTKQIRLNLVIYSLFLVIAVAGIIYGNAIRDNYSFLRIWDFRNILLLLVGVPFLFWQSGVCLPNFFEQQISNRHRFLWPAIIGALFGLLDIIVIKLIMHPAPYTELPPFLQPFPYSVFLYFSGAFEIEVFYRLIPITLMLLIGKWLWGGRYFNIFLWSAILLSSLREPLEQLPGGELWFVSYSLVTGFLMNYLQAVYYKNAGFLASLALRLGHYSFWHILLGIYVQYIELQ
ncbi:hypothetical protein CHU92_15340 [Flavobacterium cyanobacteriorum]|uniref:CPBP family intramembrane metalloprotease n=1 Tax=Flavobacterium cyanobacteriorum TaxID=2022802 RepID=A0A255YRL6_9FLAO|nr:hypothetical protein [Flavobacterium cyanobacteriorum]OYQ31867.1 hypothetical protein CHU92_15340 [Flavobacterium cyanobacteriorum]